MANCILVAGAGGFIGGHLVAALLNKGYAVRAVDIKPLDEWWQTYAEAEKLVMDLRDPRCCRLAVSGCDAVYNLAADMGGMGFIHDHKALCMLSVLINTNLLQSSKDLGVARFFFASSACIYPVHLQADQNAVALKEDDAYPAQPEDGYGWEKIFSERMCRHFMEDFGLETRIARYHNVYGPFGSWRGGREKAPAAICRKVALAKLTGQREIEIWGDGTQTRTFQYIEDCIKGTIAIMESDIREPVNLGSSELVSINALVELVSTIAGFTIVPVYQPNRPVGVKGRKSDNTLIRRYLSWEPNIPISDGLVPTYRWIYDQAFQMHYSNPLQISSPLVKSCLGM